MGRRHAGRRWRLTGDEGAKDAEGTLEGGEDEEELAWGRPS